MTMIKKIYLIQLIIITVAVFIFYFFAFSSLPFINQMALKSKDLYFHILWAIKKPPSQINKIAILTIDDRTQEIMNVRWPWKRTFFIPILEKLNLYNPKVIYLNFSFMGKTPGEEVTDALFMEGLKEAKNLVIPSLIDSEGKLQLPYKPFLESVAKTGFSNKIKDEDAIIRRGRIFHIENKKIDQYSAEISILSQYTGIEEERLLEEIPIKKDGIALINYLANPQEFHTYPAIDLLNDMISKEEIHDKIVLVGSTATIAIDLFDTPIGTIPGIYLTANTLLMHLSKNYIKEIGPLGTYIIAFLIMLGVGLITFKTPSLKGLSLLTGIAILIFFAGCILFNLGFILDYFNICLSLIITFIVIGFFKYIVHLEEKIIALNLANIEIQKAQREIVRREQLSTIGKMTSQIVHEFSNPIGNLGSCLEFLNKKIVQGHEHKEFVEDAIKEVQKMLQISKQLKSSYTPHYENPILEDVNKLIMEVVDSTRYRLGQKEIKLETNLDPELPKTLMVPDKIKQVFLNMILNAEAAVEKGGKIEITNTKETIGEKEYINIKFKDNGCGIPPEYLPKVFDAFFTTSKTGEGSGLGLFICYEIIKAHQGEITVESKVGIGTVFIIRLPIEK